VIALLLATGIRAGEAAGLADDDVDLERREIRIRTAETHADDGRSPSACVGGAGPRVAAVPRRNGSRECRRPISPNSHGRTSPSGSSFAVMNAYMPPCRRAFTDPRLRGRQRRRRRGWEGRLDRDCQPPLPLNCRDARQRWSPSKAEFPAPSVPSFRANGRRGCRRQAPARASSLHPSCWRRPASSHSRG
jgi:integrase